MTSNNSAYCRYTSVLPLQVHLIKELPSFPVFQKADGIRIARDGLLPILSGMATWPFPEGEHACTRYSRPNPRGSTKEPISVLNRLMATDAVSFSVADIVQSFPAFLTGGPLNRANIQAKSSAITGGAVLVFQSNRVGHEHGSWQAICGSHNRSPCLLKTKGIQGHHLAQVVPHRRPAAAFEQSIICPEVGNLSHRHIPEVD